MPVAKPELSDSRIIAHIDMDCFYVQVEQRKRPELRGLPTAVVQYNSWQGGGLIAVSYEARKHGVKRSMRGEEAKQVCPEIHLVQVPVAHGKADLSIYRNAGSEVVSILAKRGRCERASIDEVYLDLTDAAEKMLAETPLESLELIDEEALKSHVLGLEDGTNMKDIVKEWMSRSTSDHRDKLLAFGALIVAELRMEVLKETEFTCSAGIAHNKMLAKLASGMNKPAQQTLVPSSSVKDLLNCLPIKKMKQLGGKLGSSIQNDLGVNTVGDLLQFSEEKLQECYGINTGTWLWNIARGICGEEVQGRLLPKSHGSGKTFPGPRALKTLPSVQKWLNELCEELYERLKSDLEQNKRIAHTLTLHARAYKAVAVIIHSWQSEYDQSSDTDSQKKFPSKSCPLRYGASKIQEDALILFQSGLRDFLSSYKVKSLSNQCHRWGITALSVSASKIVDIPSGTCSIMNYFNGQRTNFSSLNESHEKLIQETTPSLDSGCGQSSERNLVENVEVAEKETSFKGLKHFEDHFYEERIFSRDDEERIHLKDEEETILSKYEEERVLLEDGEKRVILEDGEEEVLLEDGEERVLLEDRKERILSDDEDPACSSSQSAHGIIIKKSSLLSASGNESFKGLTETEQHKELSGGESRRKCALPRSERKEQKTNTSKTKGASSILRFFRSCDNIPVLNHDHDRVVDTTGASSSGFQFAQRNCPEGNLSQLPTEASPIMEAGPSCDRGNPGQHAQRTERWDYKIDEIDSSVIDELPMEIQQEVRAWLRPQKRVNTTKRGSDIAHYFLPAKDR